MDRRNRRDVGVASVIGGALVVATLAVGQVFGGPTSTSVEGAGPSRSGGAIVVAGGGPGAAGAGAGGGRAAGAGDGTGRSGRNPTDDATRAPAGGPGTASARRRAADGGTAGRPTGRGSGAVTSAVGETGTSGTSGESPEPDAPSAGDDTPPGTGGDVGGDGPVTTAAVRLDVTDLSVTGTDSGTLRSGSEVRVRLTTTRQEARSGADGVRRVSGGAADGTPAAASGTGAGGDRGAGSTSIGAGATSAGAGATSTAGAGSPATAVGTAASGVADGLPDRLDVRIRLDDAAVAALGATAPGSGGPVALRALVDLVERSSAADGATDSGRYAVRIRLQLTPAEATRAVVSAGERTDDGASNVVAVTTPIGPTPSDDGPSGDQPSGATVEIRVPVPTGATSTGPEDGTNVGVPIPEAAGGSPDAGPSIADAAVVVHVPTSDEPIGGVSEDLTPAPDAGGSATPGGPSGTDPGGPSTPGGPSNTDAGGPSTPGAPSNTDAGGPSTPDETPTPDDGGTDGPAGGSDGGPADGGDGGATPGAERPANPIGDAARFLDQLTGALGTLLTGAGD